LTAGEETLPEWVPLAFHYRRLADPEYQRELKGGEGVLGRWTAKGGRLLGDLKTGLRGESDESKLVKRDRQALPYLTVYQEALKQAAAQTVSPKAAHLEVLATYQEAGTAAGEPQKVVNRVFWAQAQLRGELSSGNPREEPFWGLLVRPAEQVWRVLQSQAQDHLEKLWQESVLAEGKGLSGWELVEALQGPEGKIWEFQDKELSAFLDKDRKRGYLSRKLHGGSMHFSPAFLALLSRGKLSGSALQGEYRVQVAALPTDANPGASLQPHRTSLVLQCSAGPQELINLNYPITKNLVWTPGSCAGTTLEVAIGDALLTRRYKGYDGFLQFLTEFRRGSRVFRREEFPEQQAILAGYDVNRITVNYSFEGQGKALRLTQFRPDSVPSRIFE
jgi:type VI secretion system protein ImpL